MDMGMGMGMGMGMAGFVEDLDQLLAAMSLRSSATSSAPMAAAPPAAADLRRGPWTVDEDILLVNYIAAHGAGRWNSLARSAGLKRIGKSCRLRWLNYLSPDVRRGNITAEEQLLILDLHSRWGNRWSKIAQHLPGRTDNEVKNYWRTRVQKQARHLRCDVSSASFRHVVRHIWMPRLRERAQADREDHQGVPAASEAHHHHHHHQYYSEEPPGWTAAATALSPDYASSALRAPSSLTADDASNYTAAYTSAATATPTTNDQQGSRPVVLHQCGADDARTGPTTTDAAGDDDVFAGTTCSELLATATGGPDDDSSSMSTIGLQLQDFGFGDFEDGLWSLDDLCCDELNC